MSLSSKLSALSLSRGSLQDESNEIIEAIFSAMLGQNVKLEPTDSNNNTNSLNTINKFQNIREFFELMYKDAGFDLSYLNRSINLLNEYQSLSLLRHEIKISTQFGETYVIKCSLNDTVNTIKERIENEEAMDRYHFELEFYNKILAGNKSLKSYNISNGDELKMVISLKGFYLILKRRGEKSKIVPCSDDENFEKILRKQRDNLNIPDLMLETEHDQSAPFKRLNIRPGSIFYMRRPYFTGGEVAVKIPLGKSFFITAKEGDTVFEIKRKIQDSQNIPIRRQNLVYLGQDLDDKLTLNDYEVQAASSTLQLIITAEEYLKLFVRTLTGKTIAVDNVRDVDTVRDLKLKLHPLINVPVEQMALVFNAERLDNNVTISDCQIKNENTLHLIVHLKNVGSVALNAKMSNGKVYDIRTDLDNTVEDFKCRVNEILSINLNSIIVMFGGKRLDEHKLLGECNVVNGTTLNILLKQNEYIYLKRDELLDPPYDYDFTNINDANTTFRRGSKPYFRPCGWKRFAIKASKQYENEIWLGSSNSNGEWPVAYHGTDFDSLPSVFGEINLSNFQTKPYSKAHLTTSNINDAEQFAQTINVNGREIKFIIQSRVRPDKIINSNDNKYMLLPTHEDIRPYGICYKYVK